MSRPGTSQGRNLTLTEELEKLEQSITLTLQEIDHNFSRAHRIVTTSILPIVEQYGEHSKNVWEASKFWKQFFEASANVSLSGYEELAGDETATAEETDLGDTTATTSEYDTTVTQQEEEGEATATATEHSGYRQNEVDDSLLLDDAEMTGSTPRPPATKSLRLGQGGSGRSPLKGRMKGKEDWIAAAEDDDETDNGDDERIVDDDATVELPAYATSRLPDMNMTMTPRSSSSLLLDDPTQGQQRSTARKNKDPLLHRVLNKNYRIQATPHKTVVPPPPNFNRRSPEKKQEAEAGDEEDRTRRALWADSPMSSPEMAVPKLRSDLYRMSPVRGNNRRGAGVGDAGGPRTPGVSVQTPATARKRGDEIFFKDVASKGKGKGIEMGKGEGATDNKRDRDEITWESDGDDDDEYEYGVDDDTGRVLFGGMSPPKTIQFALPPSKLLQTPAREASRRIVDDILIHAGADPEESSEYSPTMVKMNHDILDDTF